MRSSIQSGCIGTVAGTGEPGSAGDGEIATSALLNEPKNIALDTVGNLYIADSENHLIRKVDGKTGVITTIAGSLTTTHEETGSPSMQSSGFEEDEDPLADHVAKPEDAYTQKSDLSGMVRYIGGTKTTDQRFLGDGGPATAAALNFPSAVAVEKDGTVFIADTWNHRIRQVDAKTGVITTIAGTGQARFVGEDSPAESAALNEPVALALDGKGHLYIADQSNNRIRMIELTTGIITTVAGTGDSAYSGDGAPAKESAIAGPSGVAVDKDGNLYIADTFSSRIRKVDRQTGVMETLVGGAGEFRYAPGDNESSPNLSRPYAIAIHPERRLLITDTDNHLIRVWDLQSSAMSLLAGNGKAEFNGEGGKPESCSLNYPFGVAVTAKGDVYIADTFSHRIRIIPGSSPS